MSSPSRFDDVFVSLPFAAKIWIFLWSYLAVSGWFSTYMLVSMIGETRRNDMIGDLMPETTFLWSIAVMMLSSLIVIGLLFYGRYTRKKKDVAEAALKEYEKTKVLVQPEMRFDPAVIVFWIGGSVLNTLFSAALLVTAVLYLNLLFEPPVMYLLIGFGFSFFSAVIMYLVTQFMANGILDAKAVKRLLKMIAGSDGARKVVGAVCGKLGITDMDTVNRVYDIVKDRITAKEYNELTADEVLAISRAIGGITTMYDGNAIGRNNVTGENRAGGGWLDSEQCRGGNDR
ncbi:MAG: hypothetical protein FWD92_04315 [Methanomassiliicoccaceae archaeon]|nr:hypothetical protein [Methanomassiliicoccaceae archaeon]